MNGFLLVKHLRVSVRVFSKAAPGFQINPKNEGIKKEAVDTDWWHSRERDQHAHDRPDMVVDHDQVGISTDIRNGEESERKEKKG